MIHRPTKTNSLVTGGLPVSYFNLKIIPQIVSKCRLRIIVHASSRLTSLPPTPVVIDWSHYKTNVAKAGMVDEFEKKVNWGQGFLLTLILYLFQPCL